MLKRTLVTMVLLSPLFFAYGCVHQPLQDPGAALVGAHRGTDALVLREGESFLDHPGTIISLSREEGAQYLIALARTSEPELAMLYLPHWGVWVTVTLERRPFQYTLDIRYLYAALRTRTLVELWHTHNNIDEVTYEVGSVAQLRRWTLPSDGDLGQLHAIFNVERRGKLLGYVAHVYGFTEYALRNTHVVRLRNSKNSVQKEIVGARDAVEHVQLKDIPKFANKHVGMIKLRVTFVE